MLQIIPFFFSLSIISLSVYILSSVLTIYYEYEEEVQEQYVDKFHDIPGNQLQAENRYLCKNWAVVSAVSKPTSAVRQIAADNRWCLVIVADNMSLSSDYFLASLDYTSSRLVFLNATEQDRLFPDLSSTVPWIHIGRKNIGYIFAIKNGAELIWDFDYNNQGILDIDSIINQKILSVLQSCKEASKLFNPIPYFGVNETYICPRGFPPKFARDTSATPELCTAEISFENIGVIQSIANIEPDVDAIFKLTRTYPITFEAAETFPFIMVPRNSYCPFNERATLWTKQAFLYMALPISVHSLVSDIWRSYIAQLFFHRYGINIIFSPPMVTQKSSDGNILEEFQAENDIYQKSEVLINFLFEYQLQPSTTLEDLYEELYARKFIEIEDVFFIQIWSKLLKNYL